MARRPGGARRRATSSAWPAPAARRTSARRRRSARSAPSGTRPGSDAAAIRLSDEVAAALADGRPVVALESTIIAHGLPRPDNLRVARRDRGGGARGGRGAGDDRGARRRGAGGPRRRGAARRSPGARTSLKLGVRDLGPALVRGVAGRDDGGEHRARRRPGGHRGVRHRRARRRPPRGVGRRSTSRPTCSPWRARRSWWSAPA